MRRSFVCSRPIQTKAILIATFSIVVFGGLGYSLPYSFAASNKSDLEAIAHFTICNNIMDTCDSVSVTVLKEGATGVAHIRLDTITDLGRVPNAFGNLTTSDSSIFTISDDLKSASLRPVQVVMCTDFDESNNVCNEHDTYTIGAEWTANDEPPFTDKTTNQTIQNAHANGTFTGGTFSGELKPSFNAFLINFNNGSNDNGGGGNNGATTLADVIDKLQSMDLNHHVKKSLMKPLLSADKLLGDSNASNDQSACGKIRSFENKLSAFNDKGKLTSDEAAGLAQMAKEIKSNLGCNHA